MWKKFVGAGMAVALAAGMAGGAIAATLQGAGSTFAQPVYAKWAETYKAQTGNALNYQGIGSGAGIRQILAKTVDFGATDKPMRADELAANGFVQFPTFVGGVVTVVNLPGITPGQVKLTGPVLADIFRGVIKTWSAPAIAQINPGVKLPNLPITVVHRSDGSGTTFVFTSYLSLVAPQWSSAVGANDSVQWPVGQGGKGNDGVAAFVKQTAGAIGYVEYAYAKQNNMTYTQLQTASGAFIDPNAANFAAAAAGADWSKAPGYYMLLLNQPGAKSWPITAATFIEVYKKQADAAAAANVLKFFDYGYSAAGDAQAQSLDFVVLPASVKAMVRKTWLSVVGPDGKSVYTSPNK